MSRGWTPERLRQSGTGGSKSFPPEISSNNSRPPGRGPAGPAPGGLGGAVPHQGPGVRSGRGERWQPDAADGIRSAAADGPVVRGRGAGQRLAAGRRHRGNAGNPHYLPTAEPTGPSSRTRCCCWICGANKRQPGAVFADITWVGATSRQVPAEPAAAFQAIVDARDAAVRLVQERAAPERICAAGRWIGRRGRCSRTGIRRLILHRTGHSLGENVHGNGTHLDDYETHDERRLFPGPASPSSRACISRFRRANRDQRLSRRARGGRSPGRARLEIVTLR